MTRKRSECICCSINVLRSAVLNKLKSFKLKCNKGEIQLAQQLRHQLRYLGPTLQCLGLSSGSGLDSTVLLTQTEPAIHLGDLSSCLSHLQPGLVLVQTAILGVNQQTGGHSCFFCLSHLKY